MTLKTHLKLQKHDNKIENTAQLIVRQGDINDVGKSFFKRGHNCNVNHSINYRKQKLQQVASTTYRPAKF